MLNNSWLSPCALQAEQCLLAERLRTLRDLSRSATKALAAFVGMDLLNLPDIREFVHRPDMDSRCAHRPARPM